METSESLSASYKPSPLLSNKSSKKHFLQNPHTPQSPKELYGADSEHDKKYSKQISTVSSVHEMVRNKPKFKSSDSQSGGELKF